MKKVIEERYYSMTRRIERNIAEIIMITLIIVIWVLG
jgi:hypothetical protein